LILAFDREHGFYKPKEEKLIELARNRIWIVIFILVTRKVLRALFISTFLTQKSGAKNSRCEIFPAVSSVHCAKNCKLPSTLPNVHHTNQILKKYENSSGRVLGQTVQFFTLRSLETATEKFQGDD
jgi:hypothetical protein